MCFKGVHVLPEYVLCCLHPSYDEAIWVLGDTIVIHNFPSTFLKERKNISHHASGRCIMTMSVKKPFLSCYYHMYLSSGRELRAYDLSRFPLSFLYQPFLKCEVVCLLESPKKCMTVHRRSLDADTAQGGVKGLNWSHFIIADLFRVGCDAQPGQFRLESAVLCTSALGRYWGRAPCTR